MPLEAAFGAVDPDVEVVLITVGNLRSVDDAFGATLESDEAVAVVVELTTRNESGKFGADFLDFQSRDVAGKVVRVGPDVAHAV